MVHTLLGFPRSPKRSRNEQKEASQPPEKREEGGQGALSYARRAWIIRSPARRTDKDRIARGTSKAQALWEAPSAQSGPRTRTRLADPSRARTRAKASCWPASLRA